MEKFTPESTANMIKIAGDSVTVIDETIAKIANGAPLSWELKGDLQRNVDHLKIVVGLDSVANSGQDISHLVAGISRGDARLAEGEWPAAPVRPSRGG